MYNTSCIGISAVKVSVAVVVVQKPQRKNVDRDQFFTLSETARKDYRIGTLSKVNNIIYCKNDVSKSVIK